MQTETTVTYGELNQTCHLCYKARTKFGTLVDPNGHKWIICDRCINKLWRKRQALRQEAING